MDGVKEAARDLSSNASFVLAKAVLVVATLFGLYNVAAFHGVTDDAIDRGFSHQLDMHLYAIADTLTDPADFEAYRTSEEKLQRIAAFYNGMAAMESGPVFVSSFDQPLFVEGFKGDERFGYLYGTGASGSDVVRGGAGEVFYQVESVQMNQAAFDFYGITMGKGDAPDWSSIDYAGTRIPVVLGADYEGFYHIGETIEGDLYFKRFSFTVTGFLDRGSAMYRRGEAHVSLDTSIVVPYPPKLDVSAFSADDAALGFFGIFAFGMINGDLAAPADMSASSVFDAVDDVARKSGFSELTFVHAPEYAFVMRQARAFLEKNEGFVAAMCSAVAIAGMGVVACIDAALRKRRARRIAVLRVSGFDGRRIVRDQALLWAAEYAVAAALFAAGYMAVPNKSFEAAVVTTCVLVAVFVADAAFQRALLVKPGVFGSEVGR